MWKKIFFFSVSTLFFVSCGKLCSNSEKVFQISSRFYFLGIMGILISSQMYHIISLCRQQSLQYLVYEYKNVLIFFCRCSLFFRKLYLFTTETLQNIFWYFFIEDKMKIVHTQQIQIDLFSPKNTKNKNFPRKIIIFPRKKR